MEKDSKKAIIIGASSGIGEALTSLLNKEGYILGLMGRRVALMNQTAKKFKAPFIVKFIDIADPYQAIKNFNDLIKELGGVDLVIINAGVAYPNPDLEWDLEKKTIDVNVSGFTAIADASMRHFIQQGSGHIVGISSISALKGGHRAPAYNASKAYMSNYLDGLRKKAYKLKLPIIITDVKPGYVDTPMTQGMHTFWMAPATVAADQIYDAIQKKKSRVYVTKRWRLIAWLNHILPDALSYRWF